MKKRILAFLLAVSIAVSMLVLPAAAAGNANTAVQLSITLNAMDSSQQDRPSSSRSQRASRERAKEERFSVFISSPPSAREYPPGW